MVDLFRQQNQALNRLGQTAQFAANERQRGVTNLLAQDKFDLQQQQSEFGQDIATSQEARAQAQEGRAKEQATLESELQKLNLLGNIAGGLADKNGFVSEESYNRGAERIRQFFPEEELPPYGPDTSRFVKEQSDSISNTLGEVKKQRLLQQEQDFKKELANIKAQKIPSAAKTKMKRELLEQDFLARQSAKGIAIQVNPMTGTQEGSISEGERSEFEADAKKSGLKAYFTEGEITGNWNPLVPNVQMLNFKLVKDPDFKETGVKASKPTAKPKEGVDSFINKYLNP